MERTRYNKKRLHANHDAVLAPQAKQSWLCDETSRFGPSIVLRWENYYKASLFNAWSQKRAQRRESNETQCLFTGLASLQGDSRTSERKLRLSPVTVSANVFRCLYRSQVEVMTYG